MKKLQKLLLALCFTIGLFGSSFAQTPTPDATQSGVIVGGTYTYTVPNVGGQSWAWTVINSTGTIIDGTGGEFALTDVSGYEKSITWNAVGTFYVKVVTTIDATGCTNEYAIKVDVATNDYTVAFNAGTEKVYCADDANIASGMEITLDVTLNSATPATSYYDMTVHYQVDGGTTQLATIGTDNKFNIPGIAIADPVVPGVTSVTVTVLKVVDKFGVEFSPASGNENFVITIHPIPAKPTISF